jgi:antitoxin ParD1/3/4
MAQVEKISIALPAEMVSTLRQAVDSGEYASSSEVVREALRDWTRKRGLREQGLEELRKVWRQAAADDTASVSPHDVIERLERKYQTLVDASGEREECA